MKRGQKVIYNNETRTIYAIYPNDMVSLCLIDQDEFEYLDIETDELVSINELVPLETGQKYARKCTCCGKGMNEGYFANYEYFCSDSCLHTEYTAKEWEELASDGVEEDESNDSYYWTEWEDKEDYQYQIINGILEEIN